MARLTYEKRQRLRSSQFAVPSRRAYPIDTPNRARNALARVSQFGTQDDKKKVCEAVGRKYPKIHAKSCTLTHTEAMRELSKL